MKKTRITPNKISGSKIGLVDDHKKRHCLVCKDSDILRSRRAGKVYMDGEDVVIEWYYICSSCSDATADFLRNRKETLQDEADKKQK